MADPLVDRVAVLEAKLAALTIGDLPMAALQRKLENDWQPDASVLLQAGSITTDLLPATLFAEVAAVETTAALTYAALATAGPTITPTKTGLYIVMLGAFISNDGANRRSWMSYDIGGTGAVDTDSTSYILGTGVSGGNVMRARLKMLIADTALTAKYRTAGNTATFQDRWLLAQPVRLG